MHPILIPWNTLTTGWDSYVDTFTTSAYDSTFYLAVTRDEINEETATDQISLVHNNTTAFVASGGGVIELGNVSTIAADGTLDVSGGALVLNAGLSVAGILKTANSPTLTLNNNALDLSGGQAATGGVLEASGVLTLDGITFDEKTTIKLNADTQLTSANPITIKTVDMGTYSLELGSETTDLTLADSFTLSSGKLSTQGGDLIFAGSANISSGAFLDATVTTGTAGKLEFKQGGTASGTINAEKATFKLGADYAVDGDLITSSGTTWELGTSDLDLSGGELLLGGNVVLDNIITDNHTRFELNGENATVTRNQGFTLGGLNFDNNTFTLGSATTDLTLELDSSNSTLHADVRP